MWWCKADLLALRSANTGGKSWKAKWIIKEGKRKIHLIFRRQTGWTAEERELLSSVMTALFIVCTSDPLSSHLHTENSVPTPGSRGLYTNANGFNNHS